MTMAKLLCPMVKAWARWVTVRWTKNHPSKFQGGRGFRAGGDLGWVEGPIYQRKTLRAFFLLGGTTGFLLRALWLDSGDWKNITTKHGDLHPMGSESVHQKSLEKKQTRRWFKQFVTQLDSLFGGQATTNQVFRVTWTHHTILGSQSQTVPGKACVEDHPMTCRWWRIMVSYVFIPFPDRSVGALPHGRITIAYKARADPITVLTSVRDDPPSGPFGLWSESPGHVSSSDTSSGPGVKRSCGMVMTTRLTKVGSKSHQL